jgi:hypothetical protein
MLSIRSRSFDEEKKKKSRYKMTYMVSPKVNSPSLGEKDMRPIKPSLAGRVQKYLQGKVETDCLRLQKAENKRRKHGVLLRALAEDLGALREVTPCHEKGRKSIKTGPRQQLAKGELLPLFELERMTKLI